MPIDVPLRPRRPTMGPPMAPPPQQQAAPPPSMQQSPAPPSFPGGAMPGGGAPMEAMQATMDDPEVEALRQRVMAARERLAASMAMPGGEPSAPMEGGMPGGTGAMAGSEPMGMMGGAPMAPGGALPVREASVVLVNAGLLMAPMDAMDDSMRAALRQYAQMTMPEMATMDEESLVRAVAARGGTNGAEL